jgi:arginine/lysine/ornithine decarboxylase
MSKAWDQDEFVLDPSRISLYIGATGIDATTFKREQLMDKFGIQVNKDVAQHRAVHDQHRHDAQLRGLSHRGAGQDRPRP